MADPLQMLTAALSVGANSKEQVALLGSLREILEKSPAPIKVLTPILTAKAVNAEHSVLKQWVIDLLHFAIAKSTLSIDDKTLLASQTLDTLALLLDDPQTSVVKVVIQTFTSVYPLLFRQLCSTRSNSAQWNILSTCKSRILDFVWSDSSFRGVKFSAMKFLQRVHLVQTRGVSDPRLQNKTDPSLSSCPADHPFISVTKLEAEGTKLFEELVKLLYTSHDVDLLSALLNSWANMTKLRPQMVGAIVTTLQAWTPRALELAGVSYNGIRSVEKALRILLIHISRSPNNTQFVSQINESLAGQAGRMDKAIFEEKRRKAGVIDSKKRPLPSDTPVESSKRPKLDHDSGTPTSSHVLSTFDFTSLPAPLITELIVANLNTFTESALAALVQTYRNNKDLSASRPSSLPPLDKSPSKPIPVEPRPSTPTASTSERVKTVIKDEPIDPLKMDIDQDEIEYEPDRLNEELSGDSSRQEPEDETPMDPVVAMELLKDFKLPPPPSLRKADRRTLIDKTVQRICDAGEELKNVIGKTDEAVESNVAGQSPSDIWMLMIVRMITRISEPPSHLLGDSSHDESMEGDKTKEEPEDKNTVEEEEDKLAERQDKVRERLLDYIMKDFVGRMPLATSWMNEEWYNDRIRSLRSRNWRPNYDIWLNQILAAYQTLFDGKDRTFSRFLLDLPFLPTNVLDLLREWCVDLESPERMQIGFVTLRGFVTQRPAMRNEALHVLLELTTHPDRKSRGAAINTVKQWVGTGQSIDDLVRVFALQMLRKLQMGPTVPKATEVASQVDVKMANGTGEGDGEATSPAELIEAKDERILEDGEEEDDRMEDGQITPEELLQTPYLPERITLPAEESMVLQHVELLFALSIKVPEFLDELFAAYGQMDITVQEAIQRLITALIRSLGPNHGKLLTLLRNFPPGSESLVLRVLEIFSESGRPSSQVVALTKGLINDRNLDARFLIPIIAEMDKPDIIRHLPRIVSILNNDREAKETVKNVFSSIVTTPPQTFGSVSSNMPRVRQSELLTPAELMVLLHESEKEIGVKSAIEGMLTGLLDSHLLLIDHPNLALSICFSMTDVFRSEILAVVMQQIVDEPVLPVLFMRTVIQAINVYSSLRIFVSTTLMSRLITKKIWTNPNLWEGFIRLSGKLGQQCFGALLQLPKDQLRDLVNKQPSLKGELRDFVTKKATNKARVAGFLDILGEVEPSVSEGESIAKAESPAPDSTPSSPEITS